MLAMITLIALLVAGCEERARARNSPGSNSVPNVISVLSGTSTNISPGMEATPLDSTNVLRSFVARGLVREVPSNRQTLLVRHEAIPGFMPKMTMSFNVRDPKLLPLLHPGDAIAFEVKATEEESWIENVRRITTNELTAISPPSDPASSVLLHAAKMKPGDLLPDAELLGEDGQPLKLSQLAGRAVAFTFIFTRCPLPDYCPRMNRNFIQARELLQQRTDGPTNWQFLSISFDPEFDKPGVLTRYAFSYRGQNANRWSFASAANSVMANFSSQLDFRFANEGGSFLHNLRTVVLDPQRRVFRQFDGNRWTPKELADAMEEATRAVNPSRVTSRE